MSRKSTWKTILIIVSIFMFCIGFLIYSLHPKLTNFRHTIFGFCINCLPIIALVLYFTCDKRRKVHVLGKINLWLFLALYISLSFLNLGKIEALFLFIYSIFNVITAIYLYKTKKKGHAIVWPFGCLAYLAIIIQILKVEFINKNSDLKFALISTIITIIFFIPYLAYTIHKFVSNKNYGELINKPLIALIIVFIFSFVTITSLNFYLDNSTPNYEEYQIIDKDIQVGAKKITTYEFKVKKGDTVFTISVSELTYYDYEINDLIVLTIYSGAFNAPYYIFESDKQKS